jgi:hypothetical protein
MNRRTPRLTAALPLASALLAFFMVEGFAPADRAPPAPPLASPPARGLVTSPASASPVVTLAPATTAAASASARPSMTASAAVSAPAKGKSFQEEPPGAEKSAAPSVEAWREAPLVALDRGVAACRAYRVREWLKIHCDSFPAAGVSLLAGDPEGVLTWVDPVTEGTSQEAMKKPRGAQVIFPVRRGDGRVVQIAQFGEGYDGPLGWNAGFTVSEQWLPEEPSPLITVW